MRFNYKFLTSKVILIAALLPLHAQADVYVGSNVRIGSNVTVNSNKIKVNNTTVNEEGISIPANAGYLGLASDKTTYTCTAKSPNVDFKGDNQKVTIKGDCQTVSIKGKNNVIIAQQTFNLLESGVDNTISITRVRHVMSTGKNTSLTYRSGIEADAE